MLSTTQKTKKMCSTNLTKKHTKKITTKNGGETKCS